MTKPGSFRKQTYGLLISWMLLAFLVGNAYKGVLFSFLTTLSVPVVPKTLQEVVQSDYLVLTTKTIVVANEFERDEISGAKLFIDLIMKEAKAGKLKIRNSNLYQQLNDTLIYLKSVEAFDLFIAMETGVELKGEIKSYKIPKKIIIFDSGSIVKLFGELNTIFTNNLLIFGETLDLFSVRNQWVVRRNALYRLILPFAAGLDESGIFSRWRNYREMMINYYQLSSSRRMLIKYFKNSKSQLSPNDNIIAYLLFKPHTAQSNSEAEPITMTFFFVFAKLFGYCVVICSTVFMLEKLSGMMIRESIFKATRQLIYWYYATRNVIIRA